MWWCIILYDEQHDRSTMCSKRWERWPFLCSRWNLWPIVCTIVLAKSKSGALTCPWSKMNATPKMFTSVSSRVTSLKVGPCPLLLTRKGVSMASLPVFVLKRRERPKLVWEFAQLQKYCCSLKLSKSVDWLCNCLKVCANWLYMTESKQRGVVSSNIVRRWQDAPKLAAHLLFVQSCAVRPKLSRSVRSDVQSDQM